MSRLVHRSSSLALSCLFACLLSCRATSGGGGAPVDTSKSAAQAPISVAQVVLSAPGQDAITVAVEVAETSAERQQGLMFRKHLDPDAGMLFLFEHPQPLTFWMHNTFVPLDMFFITDQWRVLGVVENATPLTDSPRAVPGEARYVLEVNAGFARRHGLGAGTSVRYVPASD
jgi:uncharacterized membrane protein (UPF0127 family)